jgi:2,4-dienoyl-CoA reductase-like NADH-dependent reductase (Old Yellow Enzyme family)
MEIKMSKLFEKTAIKGMTLANRFIRSATWEGLAGDDGSCTPELSRLMAQLANGGIGLIISGYAFVSPEGQAGRRQLGIHEDRLINGLVHMTEAVHNAGGKIVLQLAHGGCHASSALTRQEAIGPSSMHRNQNLMCRQMTREEIGRLTEDFGKGAERAMEAGFGGVQLHAAHGYLLSQFLSPYYNSRTDEYGGTIENRARFLLDICRMVRSRLGEGVPLIVKMNSEDFVEGGFNVEEMVTVSTMLEDAGVDAIELSGGTMYSGKYVPLRKGLSETVEGEAYYRDAAVSFKERLSIPLMLVGGIRSFELADKFVENGIADYISLSRPLIREPGLIARWRSGDRRKSECLSDNLCARSGIRGEGVHCVMLRKLKGEKPA